MSLVARPTLTVQWAPVNIWLHLQALTHCQMLQCTTCVLFPSFGKVFVCSVRDPRFTDSPRIGFCTGICWLQFGPSLPNRERGTAQSFSARVILCQSIRNLSCSTDLAVGTAQSSIDLCLREELMRKAQVWEGLGSWLHTGEAYMPAGCSRFFTFVMLFILRPFCKYS